MTSIFMLSFLNKKLFNIIVSRINKLSEMNFILENFVLKKKYLSLGK
jgi:hypothetical protein